MTTTNLQPPKVTDSLISFPTPQILLVTFNRPNQMNCINRRGHMELDALWKWYDATPQLRCAVVTGATPGPGDKRRRAFCAGADLKEWDARTSNNDNSSTSLVSGGGFAGLSTRVGKKPIIAAVHGLCLGGGMEAALNCDLIIAHSTSTFGLPETLRGVVPIAGVLPRLVNIVGMQRAAEMAIAGRTLTAREGVEWGFVNTVVDGEREGKDAVVKEALKVAEKIGQMSPDAVVVTRAGLRGAWNGREINESVRAVEEGAFQRMQGGENIKEGLKAFVEKRKPRWVDSKL